MGGYKASEANIKKVLNKAMLKRLDGTAFVVKMAKQQLSILLDRTAHGFSPLSADIVESEKPKLEMAICRAELNDAEAFLAYSYLVKSLLNGSLIDVLDVIEREAMKDMLMDGLKSLVTEFRVRNHGFEESMSTPGFMDQLQSDVENWGTRRDEFEQALYRLDIQAAGDWLLGTYSPEGPPQMQAGEPIEAQQQDRKAISFRYLQEKFDTATADERKAFFFSNSGNTGHEIKQNEFFQDVYEKVKKDAGSLALSTFIRNDVRDFKNDLKKRIADKENG